MDWDLLRFMLIGGWPDGLVGGVAINLFLFVVALVAGLVIAVPVALLRLSASWPVRAAATGLVEILRSTPLLLLVFWAYLLLPLMTGGSPDPLHSALLALVLYSAAYQSEIVRAGFASVPAGEVEAALVAGMSRTQVSLHVVIAQGLRRMVPASFSFAVSLFKDTAVVYVVGVVDLMQTGLIASERHPNDMLANYLMMAACFFVIGLIITLIGRRFERRLAFTRRAAA
jgi:His/Glu/Gln/Arg/opine family amino acid ABC transporter permease subunit